MIDSSPDLSIISDGLSHLPDEARLWVYGSNRDLTDDEVSIVRNAMSDFLREWSSHGRDVSGEADVVENRFLLVGAHIPSGDISGCGIDKSTRVVSELARQLDIEWLPALNIFYRDNDRARSATRGEFRELAREGSVGAETLVYDLTIDTVGGLRRGLFLQPAGQSWHGRAFDLQSA